MGQTSTFKVIEQERRAMKQRVLEQARSTVEGFLHRQCADTTLGVLSVDPEVDGYGDELLLVHLTYDDSNGAEGLGVRQNLGK